MEDTNNATFVNILQDYILVLQDIIARQDGCSDFWDMKYDDMWFIELLRKHLTEYKFIFNVD